jgi:hypothetical protein
MVCHLTLGEDNDFERRLLMTPIEEKQRPEKTAGDLVPFDEAPEKIRMSRGAFDYLVAENSEIFKKIARWNNRWYLPRFYLQRIDASTGFSLIREKYELLAKNGKRLLRLKQVPVCKPITEAIESKASVMVYATPRISGCISNTEEGEIRLLQSSPCSPSAPCGLQV